MDNAQLDKKCNFISNIKNEDAYREQLAMAMGHDRASEIIKNQEVQKMFRDEFDQLKDDRDALRFDIMRTGI